MSIPEMPDGKRVRPTEVRLLGWVNAARLPAMIKVLQELPARIMRRPPAKTVTAPRHGLRAGNPLHPLPVRVMHWVNAIAMIVMVGSGWGIYDDSVIISGLHFPKAMRLGDWAAESLLWHFAGMWFLAINGLVYLAYGAATGRFRERLLPIKVREILKTVNETLHFKIAHEDITHYNAVQKLLYVVVIAAGISQVLTGLAIWKPVQFWFLADLFGGFQGARVFHFLGMVVIVGFLVVHVSLSLLVPKTLAAMITGGPRIAKPSTQVEAET